MEYRHGKCSACGAEYKIPTSFAHDAAKCKQCGGVVHIGPAPGGSKQVPARNVAGAQGTASAATPAGKKGGTLERLKAQRKPPAAAPQPKRGGGTLERLKAERGAGAVEQAPKPTPVTAGATSRRSGGSTARRRAGARRRGGDDTEADEGARAGFRGRQKKNNTPLMIGALAFLVIMGVVFGAYMMFVEGDSATEAAETSATAPDAGEGAGADPLDGTSGVQDDAAADGAGDGAGGGAGGGAADDADPEPVDKPKPKPVKKGDPASVDLTAINDFGPAAGTTDEEWTDLNDKMRLFLADDGARSQRALRALEATGRKAMPVIINYLKTLDFASEAGYRTGDVCQRTMQAICNGNNFGWKYSTEPLDVYYNKRAVRFWATSWAKVDVSIDAWIVLAKLENKDPAEAKRLKELYGDGVSAELQDEFDDLDVD